MRLYHDQPSGTVQQARELRKHAPEPERRLLHALRAAHPHLKWRHQTPVGPYYADILCHAERLIIEIDGDTHAATADQDATRTRFLQNEGYHVTRFTNADVMANLDGVTAHIAVSLGKKARKDGGNRAQKKGGTA